MKPWFLSMLSTALLAGCTSLPRLVSMSGDEAAGAAAQQARAEALGLGNGDCMAPGWTMGGRVALSNGRDGGSAGIEWTQGAGSLRMLLSAPVTRQSWVLDVDKHGASLRGLRSETLRGSDPAGLLRDTTGWDIPVAALGCWLRAVAADAGKFGQAWIEYRKDLLPRRLEQDGWAVEYDDWKPDPLTGLSMPTRIYAQRGNDRVRLVVDRWGAE